MIYFHDYEAFSRAPQVVLRPLPAFEIPDVEHSDLSGVGAATTVAVVRGGGFVTGAGDGRILLWTGTSKEAPRVVGRSGQGPGEFIYPRSFSVGAGDTVLVADVVTGRLTALSLHRPSAMGTTSLVPRLPDGVNHLVGRLPTGGLVFTKAAAVAQEATAGKSRGIAPVVLLPPEGAARTLTEVPDLDLATMASRYRGRPGLVTMPVGFGRRASLAVWGDGVVVGDGSAYTFDVWSPAGRIVRSVQVAVSRRPVTRQMRRAEADAALAALREGREPLVDPAETERLFRERPYADSMPAYGQFFVTPEQWLWVLDPIAPGDSEWTATGFRLDGAIVRRARGPAGRVPVGFWEDRVLVRVEDPDGLVRLFVHPLVPAR